MGKFYINLPSAVNVYINSAVNVYINSTVNVYINVVIHMAEQHSLLRRRKLGPTIFHYYVMHRNCKTGLKEAPGRLEPQGQEVEW